MWPGFRAELSKYGVLFVYFPVTGTSSRNID